MGMNNARRPAPRNPGVWRKVRAAEIDAAERRAAERVHEHSYYNHITLSTHMVCNCGYLCRRDFVPEDLVFVGPAVKRG